MARAQFTLSSFDEVNATETDLSDAVLRDCRAGWVTLSAATLSGLTLIDSVFSDVQADESASPTLEGSALFVRG